MILSLAGILPNSQTGVPQIPSVDGDSTDTHPSGNGNIPAPPSAPGWKMYPYNDGPFSFPEDEGLHLDALEEWWYVNGHLTAQDGRRIDVMVCFYKHGIIAASLFDESTGVYLNHTETYLDLQRDIGHLSLQFGPNGLHQVDGKPFTYQLDYRSQDFGVSLLLESRQRPLLASGDGVIRMGRGLSYYYSLTDIAATGTVSVGTEALAVSGKGWMDRQWGSWSPKLHWDWFSISLDNGMQVLAYRMFEQGNDQPIREYVSAIDARGGTYHFNRSDEYCTLVFDYHGYWQSPLTGKLYSSGWGLTVPGMGLSIELTPLSPSQETLFPADERLARERMPFWEGACKVTGFLKGEQVTGRAFVESTYDYVYADGDLVVTPQEYVQDGHGSKLIMMVENRGGHSLADVELRLFLGSPYEGGKILATYDLDSARRNYTYVSDNLPDFGAVPLFMVVDPDNHFAELQERNNIAMATLK
jgi:predicted secreted hydrolase